MSGSAIQDGDLNDSKGMGNASPGDNMGRCHGGGGGERVDSRKFCCLFIFTILLTTVLLTFIATKQPCIIGLAICFIHLFATTMGMKGIHSSIH